MSDKTNDIWNEQQQEIKEETAPKIPKICKLEKTGVIANQIITAIIWGNTQGWVDDRIIH